MERSLQSIAEYLGGKFSGDGSIRITGISNLDDAHTGDLTFAEDGKNLLKARSTLASAVIVPSGIEELGGIPIIVVENPKLAFALALELFYPSPALKSGIHPSAVVGDDFSLGDGTAIRAHAVVGDRVRVGCKSVIESGVHLGDDVSVGDNCFIGPNVVVYRETHIGNRVRIHGGTVIGGDGFGYVFHQGRYVKVPQVGDVIIEDDVEIGCNVCIDRATLGSTIIKRGTKIDNLVQVAHNNLIGEHVIMTGQVGLSGSVKVGNYVVMGGKTGVVDHVEIGDRVKIGAASVVTKSVPDGSIVWGYPARDIRKKKLELASLARLPSILKELTKRISHLKEIEKRLTPPHKQI